MPRRTGRSRDPFDPLDAPVQETLDLHGFSAVDARAHVPTWLAAARKRHPGGLVLLITGRGRGSAGAPVLGRIVRALLREAKESGVVEEWSDDASGGACRVRLKDR